VVPVQGDGLVDLAAERVRHHRELEAPAERVLDEEADLAEPQQRPAHDADDRRRTGAVVPIVSDGGITCPGDAAKAFGAGADFIMMGGLFSGTDESAGDEIVKPDGSRVKLFYGMSSGVAMHKHAGGVAEYRSSEGKAVEVPAKGPVKGVILDLLGGIRSSCTYVGAASLRELPKRTTFIRVTQQLNTVFGSHDLSKKQ